MSSRLSEAQVVATLPVLKKALERLNFLEHTWNANPAAYENLKTEFLESIHTEAVRSLTEQNEAREKFLSLAKGVHLSSTHEEVYQVSQTCVRRLSNLLMSTPDPTKRIEESRMKRAFFCDMITALVTELETDGDCKKYISRVQQMKDKQTEYQALLKQHTQLEQENSELVRAMERSDADSRSQIAKRLGELAAAEGKLQSLTREHKDQLDYINRKIKATDECMMAYSREAELDR